MGSVLFVSIVIWGLFILGGPENENLIDPPKILQTSENEFYYIKESSWKKTFLVGGIILPSQVHLFENGVEIPADVDILWPDDDLFNRNIQTIIPINPVDQSDPGLNGRIYTITWQWKPGHAPLIVSLFLSLLSSNLLAVIYIKRHKSGLLDVSSAPTPDEGRNFFLMGMVIMIVNGLILSVVFLLVSILVKNHVDQSVIDSQIWPAFRFKPEQTERTIYLSGLTLFPILCLINWVLLMKHKPWGELTATIIFPIIGFQVVCGIGLDLYFAVQNNHMFYIQNLPLLQDIWLVIPVWIILSLAVIIEYRYRPKLLNKLTNIFLAIFLLIIFIFIIFTTFVTEFDPSIHAYTPHFSAYAYSINQVFNGKTILIDLQTQYGFYPYFLQPIFNILGMGIVQFELVMTFLQTIFFVIILFLVSRLVKSRIIYWCSICVIPGTWLWSINNINGNENYGNYYQYWPHRVIFPGLILLLMWFYQKTSGNRRKIITAFAYLLSSFSVLWNFDSGLIVLVSWVIFMVFEALTRLNVDGIKNTIISVVTVIFKAGLLTVSLIGLLNFYTYLRSGQFADLKNYLFYQSIFYNSGFFMLSMPVTFHLWNLVLLVYAVGILLGIFYLGKVFVNKKGGEKESPQIKIVMIFMVSIIGCGLFSYYQGRSHDSNLIASSWSFWFLIVIYTDWIMQILFSRKQPPLLFQGLFSKAGIGLFGLLLTWILFSYWGGMISFFPANLTKTQNNVENIRHLLNKESSPYAQDVRLIKENFAPQSDVLILSNYNQAYLYIESGMKNPLSVPSFGELFLKSDYEKVSHFISQNKTEKIVMSNDFSDDFPKLFQQVVDNYKVAQRGHSIIIYSP